MTKLRGVGRGKLATCASSITKPGRARIAGVEHCAVLQTSDSRATAVRSLRPAAAICRLHEAPAHERPTSSTSSPPRQPTPRSGQAAPLAGVHVNGHEAFAPLVRRRPCDIQRGGPGRAAHGPRELASSSPGTVRSGQLVDSGDWNQAALTYLPLAAGRRLGAGCLISAVSPALRPCVAPARPRDVRVSISSTLPFRFLGGEITCVYGLLRIASTRHIAGEDCGLPIPRVLPMGHSACGMPIASNERALRRPGHTPSANSWSRPTAAVSGLTLDGTSTVQRLGEPERPHDRAATSRRGSSGDCRSATRAAALRRPAPGVHRSRPRADTSNACPSWSNRFMNWPGYGVPVQVLLLATTGGLDRMAILGGTSGASCPTDGSFQFPSGFTEVRCRLAGMSTRSIGSAAQVERR